MSGETKTILCNLKGAIEPDLSDEGKNKYIRKAFGHECVARDVLVANPDDHAVIWQYLEMPTDSWGQAHRIALMGFLDNAAGV